jgi:hypothetical protein
MDWFILAAPIALLVIVLLLGFVGCALDVEGYGFSGIILNYSHIPKKVNPISRIEATFVVSGVALPVAKKDVEWENGQIKPGYLEMPFDTPDEPTVYTCSVKLFRGDDVPALEPVTASLMVQSDPVITLRLSYAEWPPSEGQPQPDPNEYWGIFSLYYWN